MKSIRFEGTSVVTLSLCLLPSVGYADTGVAGSAQPGTADEIVVTAQKREERINDVPLSITAMTGDQLKSQNVTEAKDLARVVPGFNVQTALNGSPVFYIRGVGFSDTSPTVAPAVTIYADEVPLPLSDMSRGAALDLARVEVLKGPQGTLFGGNSTGGAVNFIAAKPTDRFEAGGTLGFGRFAAASVEGHVSGPLSDAVSVRVAGEYRMQDGWQYSATQPGAKNGQKDFLNGRISVAIKPSSNLKLLLTASGWRDRSDTQQPQFVRLNPSLTPQPFLPPPTNAAIQAVIDGMTAASYAPTNARIADWLQGYSRRRDDSFYQFSLRGDLDLSDRVTLTSITSYSHMSLAVPLTLSGENFPAYNLATAGSDLFTQELRLSGRISSLRWMIGGNYQHNNTPNTGYDAPFDVTNAQGLYNAFRMVNDQQVTDYAVFGSLEKKLTDTITARASIRYSQEDRKHQGCLADSGNGQLAGAFGQVIIPLLLGGSPTNIAPGACVTLDDTTRQVNSGLTPSSLNQNNVSWRLGLDWKAAPGTLLYATAAKGFKGGSYSTEPAVFASQMTPVSQESVLAYEAGIKTDLLDRKLHLDLSGFYYDYKNKQLQGFGVYFPFGPLPVLVNIPKSRVIGGEFALTAHPTQGLRVMVSGTILDTKVLRDPVNPLDPFGQPTSYVGEAFPNTPKYQLAADAEQSFPISGNATGYVGAGLQYHSSAIGVFGVATAPLAASLTRLPPYTLLDLRAGVRLSNPNIGVEIWGNNVTNKYYYSAAYTFVDAFVRMAAMPSTWGVRIKFDY